MMNKPVMRDGITEPHGELERFRDYLHFLAEIKLDRQLRGRVDASDIVQETMLRAYTAWDTFRGDDSRQRAAWLRQILMRTILHTLRDAHCGKRDIARERHLQQAIDQSSQQIAGWLAADATSPQSAAQTAEELLRVADALQTLPEPQRMAVMRYYWQEYTLAEIGEEMGRSAAAVGGLVQRGLRRLRETLDAA